MSLYMALQRLRTVVTGLSVRRPWNENIEVYLGLWWTEGHWNTSFLLFEAFPYHSLSKNSDLSMRLIHLRLCMHLEIKGIVK